MVSVTETVVDAETGEEKEVTKKVPKMIEKEVEVDINGLVDLLGGDSQSFDAVFDKMIKKKESFSLLVGEDFYYHDKANNLARLVALLEMTCDMDIVIIPPKSNALGVALICDLDDDATGYTIGYNENGDYRLSALGDGDMDMPAFNQQEGTVTNLSKRVVPTNAALSYSGYELNMLVRALVGAPSETIYWTKKLPTGRGFKSIKFDDLQNSYGNDGSEHRGYLLETTTRDVELPSVDKFDEDAVLEGEIVCRCNPERQFNDFTDKSHQIFETFSLYASPAKAKELGERVEVVFADRTLALDVVSDDRVSGDIMKLPDFRSAEGIYDLFGSQRYKTVTIRKV
jgi:NADH-quinone oxidoreductase subunit G